MNYTYPALRFLLISVLALYACGKEQPQKPDPDPKPLPIETGNVNLRISIDPIDGLQPTAFKEGDRLAVWDKVALRKFTAVKFGDEIVFNGDAAKDGTYWVMFPYDNCSGVDSTDPDNPAFKTSIPNVQTLEKASLPADAAMFTGKGTASSTIKLKSACGYVKFSFPNAIVGGREINALKPGSLNLIVMSSASGARISGSFKACDSNGIENATSSGDSGDSMISLLFKERPEAGASYYVAMRPGGIGSLKLSFSRKEDSAVADLNLSSVSSIASSKSVNAGEIWPAWRAVDDIPDDGAANPAGHFDYSLLAKIRHPRLLASDEDFRLLKEKIAEGTYSELIRQHTNTIARADAYMGVNIPTIPELDALIDPENGSYQNTFNEKLARTSIGHLVCCAYAYRTTGQDKYLQECKKVIAQRNADAFWSKHPAGKSVAYLSPAEITMGMAVAYDWLYYELSEQERAAMRASMTTKPFEVGDSRVINYLTNEKNNRGQVHNAGILATAIALYDKNKAFSQKWMENSYNGIRTVVNGIYGTAGSTQEGYGYWEYGALFNSWYDEMLFTVFGNDTGLSDQEGFKKTGDYNLFMTDHLSPFAFSDGGRASISCCVSPWWLALRYQRPELLGTEIYLHSLGKKMSQRVMPIVPISLAKYPQQDFSHSSRPSSDIWVDSNESVSPVVLVRTGWTFTDADSYLGLKGGYASVSHGHMDTGTFEYHAFGERWSIDNAVGAYAHYDNKGLTSTAQTTSSPGVYVKWLTMAYGSLGHSTISFANYDKSIGGIAKTHNTDHIVAASSKANIIETYNSAAEKGGKIDMSKTLKGQVQSATRKAVLKSDSSLLVEDCITALSNDDGQMIWRMATPTTCTAEKVSDNIFRLKQNGKTMYLSITFDGEVSGFTLRNWGSFNNAHPGHTGEWGWSASDVKVAETINANVIGYTVTIPKGKTVTASATITPHDPSADILNGIAGEKPGFGNDSKYNW